MKKLIIIFIMTIFLTQIVYGIERSYVQNLSRNADDYIYWHTFNVSSVTMQTSHTGIALIEDGTGDWEQEFGYATTNTGGTSDGFYINYIFNNSFTVQDSYYFTTALSFNARLSYYSGDSKTHTNVINIHPFSTEYYLENSSSFTLGCNLALNKWYVLIMKVDLDNARMNATLYNITIDGTMTEECSREWVNFPAGATEVKSIRWWHDYDGGQGYSWINESAIWDGLGDMPTGAPVADTTPPTITIDSPTNQSRSNTVPLNFNISVSDDSVNQITCHLSNSTNKVDEDTQPQNTYFLLTHNTEYDQSYTETFTIQCWDNDATNNNTAIEVYQITIDTTTPTLTITAPINNSNHGSDIAVDLLAHDDYIWILNYTLYNDTNIIRSIQNDTNQSQADSGNLIIKDTIPIATLGDGQYRMNISASDSHTKLAIGNYQVIKDNPNAKLTFITEELNNVEISLLNGNINKIDTFKLIDRYTFNFDLSQKSNKKYKFHLKTSEPLILINSETAHFVSGLNWIDFVNDDATSTYELTKINDNEYYIEIQTDDLNFKSIGGLNLNEKFILLNIDQTPPIFSNLAISGVNFTEGGLIQVNATCSDTSGLNSIAVQNNETGTFVTQITEALGGETSYHYIYNDTAVLGRIAHRFICEDTLTNSGTSSNLLYNGIEEEAEVTTPTLPLQNLIESIATIGMFILIVTLVFFVIRRWQK